MGNENNREDGDYTANNPLRWDMDRLNPGSRSVRSSYVGRRKAIGRLKIEPALASEAGLLVVFALLVAVSAGLAVPLFRPLLGLALAMIVLGVALGIRARGDRSPTIRLVVADVDGTLVGADQAISPRVREAIGRAIRQGVQVALCTGRSPAASQRFISELALRGPHIFLDGALVGALGSTEDVYCLPAPASALGKLIDLCEVENIPVELYSRGQHFVAREGAASEWHGRIQGVAAEVADLRQVLRREPIIKAELLSNDPAAKAAIAALAADLGGELRFSQAQVPGYPEYVLVNVVHPDVSKGEALCRMAAWMDVPLSRVLAVGDGLNDVPLLATAGLGVAMGDAPPSVKEAATAITGTLAEDGLALAIERFALGESLEGE